MTRPPDASRPTLPAWAPFAVLIVAIVAQAGVLQGGWLLDDGRVIRDNAEVARGFAAVPRFFSEGQIETELEAGAYRPMMLATFAVESALWRDDAGELDPFFLHLTNLLLHGLAAILLLVLVRRLAPGRPLLALGTAVVFAAHPMNTGTVAALLGRADLLAAVCGLGSLCIWVRPRGLTAPDAILCGVLLFLALLSKESALALVVAYPVLDRMARGERGPAAMRYGVIGGVLGLYLLLWTGPAATSPDVDGGSLLANAALGLVGVGRMALRLIAPVGYRGDHTDEATIGEGYALGGGAGIVLMAVLVLAVWAFLKRRGAPLSAGWLLTCAMAPIAAAVLPSGSALELRFAYLVGIPLFLIAGVVIEVVVRSLARLATTPAAGYAGALVLGLLFIPLAHAEAGAWRDDEAFHDRLLRESPGHLRALIRQGRLQRNLATELWRQASLMPSEDRQGRPNLELKRVRKGRADALDAAEGWIRRALGHPEGKRSSAAWAQLGFVLLDRGRAADSLLAFANAKRFDPALKRADGTSAANTAESQLLAAASVYFHEGKAHTALGDRERASGSFQSAIRLAPRNPIYLRFAAMALMGQRRWAEGMPLLERAIRHATSAEMRKELTELLEHQRVRAREMAERMYREAEQALAANNREAALPLYEGAFLADPQQVDARIKAARIIGSYFGNYGRAHKYLNDAERIVQERPVPSEPLLQEIRKWRTFLHKRKQEDDAELDGG